MMGRIDFRPHRREINTKGSFTGFAPYQAPFLRWHRINVSDFIGSQINSMRKKQALSLPQAGKGSFRALPWGV